MNRHATLALTALFCGVSLLTADLAVAERELAYRVPEGLTYTFREMQRSNNTLTISGNGQQGEVQQGISTTIAGAATVLAVRDGKPATLRLTFDAASGTEYTINGMPQPDAFALAGQTVEVVVRGDKIVDVRQDGSPLNLDAATLCSTMRCCRHRASASATAGRQKSSRRTARPARRWCSASQASAARAIQRLRR